MVFGILRRGRKGREPPASARPPVDRVAELSRRGIPGEEISRGLREEGYSPPDIDRAVRESVREGIAGPRELPPAPEPRPPEPRPLPPRAPEPLPPAGPPAPEPAARVPPELEPPLRAEEFRRRTELPKVSDELELKTPWEPGPEEPRPPAPAERRPLPPRAPGVRKKEVEEIAEEIIDEKWVDLEDKIRNMEEKFRDLGAKISRLDEGINQIKWERKNEIQEIDKKIDTYKDSMSEINTRIESMEKAMKDSLAPMMQSLRSLSDTIRALRGGGERKKPKAEE